MNIEIEEQGILLVTDYSPSTANPLPAREPRRRAPASKAVREAAEEESEKSRS